MKTKRRPCVNRRYGCVGYVEPQRAKHRGADGVLREITALICTKCGQAHGRAA